MNSTKTFGLLAVACCALLLSSAPKATAQCASGQTEVTITINGGSFPAEIVWELVDDVTSTVVASRACGTAGGSVEDICLNDGQTYTFNAFDDWGDGWNGGTFEVKIKDSGCVLAAGAPNNGVGGDNTDNCVGFDLEQSVTFQTDAPISGCTNPAASNFNICATIDDGSCLLPAPNDACADAIAIPAGTCFSGSNVGATAGDSPLDAACVDGNLTPSDIWFTTTVPASGALRVVVANQPGFSSIYEFYLGDCSDLGPGILASLGACTNYSTGTGLTLSGLPAGATLYIRWWDFGSNDFGPVSLCVEEPALGCTDPCASNFDPAASIDDGSCVLPALDADECVDAATITAGTTAFYSQGASGTDISSCTSNDSLDIWFAYEVPAGLDSLLIYTCGSSFDTGLSLWDACGGSELACNDDGTPGGIGSSCGGSNFQSYILLTDSALLNVAGSVVYIRIAGFNGTSGCGDLIIEEVAAPVACDKPVNLAAFEGPFGVTLTWDAVPGALGYRINGGLLGGPFAVTKSLTNSRFLPNSLLSAGSCYEYGVRARCSGGITSDVSDRDTFCLSAPAARLADMLDVQLFPNPANDYTVLTFSAEADEMLSVQVFDLSGKLMVSDSYNAGAGLNNYTLNTAQLLDGTYLVQLSGESMNTTLKVDVKH
jgi:hypothetical protein